MHSIVKKKDVQTGPAPVQAGPSGTTPARPRGPDGRRRHEKQVQLIQLDGVVRAIEVVCSCGEVSVIELEYPETQSATHRS